MRVQDGLKLKLLCSSCEQLFSKWEKQFADHVFYPLHKSKGKAIPLKYFDWCIRFAVSVSWRVLTYFKQLGLDYLSENQLIMSEKALQTWGEFLLGKINNPGNFPQNIFALDIIENTTIPDISPYINRYFLRSIDMDVICTSKSCMVYAKMCRLLLLGFIEEENWLQWNGDRIYLKRGSIGHKKNSVPYSLINFFNSRANSNEQTYEKLSDKQKEIINKLMISNADKLVSSEIFKATQSDIRLSRGSAFV